MRRFPQGCGVLCRLAAVLAEAFAEAQGNSLSLYPSEVAKKAQVSQQVVGQSSEPWRRGATWNASRQTDG
jgi:hypothetical protein